MATPTELFIADELPRRPYTNEFPFAAGKTLITTGVGLEVVAGDVPGEHLDNTFRIKDNGDTTKKIAFQASGIATDQTKTITMPNADVDLGKIPTGIAAEYTSGRLSMPLVDGTYVNLNTFGGTHLDGPNSPATVLSPNGHYLFFTDTAFYYGGTRLLALPEAPADKTYVRLSNVSGISSFATGAGATVAPSGSDKINGSTSTLDITTYLVDYRNAVITFTYTASSDNWNVSVLGDLIRPGSIAIYDADKTNSTTLTPITDLTVNRVITLPDADINLGDLPSVATTNTNNLTNTTARILGGSGGTASKPNATIINGIGNTANGGLSVILTGNNVNTTLGGAVVQGAYQANDTGRPGYTGQAAIKQGVVIYAKTTTATSAAMDSAGGAAVTTIGDTKVIAAVVPNGMTGVTTGSAVHEITVIGKSITGTYQAFSAKYIITCSYDGTTYTIDSMTTLHTSSRNGALLSAAITLTGSNLTITATSGSAQTILWSGYVDSIYD